MTEYGNLSNLHITLDDRKDPGVYYFTLRERGEEEEGGKKGGEGGKKGESKRERERESERKREKGKTRLRLTQICSEINCYHRNTPCSDKTLDFRASHKTLYEGK